MKSKKEYYLRIAEAIEAERAGEEAYYSSILAEKSIAKRIEAGVLWYPALLVSSHYSIGEYLELTFEKIKHLQVNHKFRTGIACRIFLEGDPTFSVGGTISFVRKYKIKILLNSQSIIKEDIEKHTHYGIEMVYDERPYKVMKETTNSVLKSQLPFVNTITDSIINSTSPNYIDQNMIPFETASFQKLNISQQLAITNCLQESHISIIHGPPGTGKTTSLVALIEQLTKRGLRILVCAPSNNAVDLLTIRLDAIQIPILRTGNVTRIGEKISHLTLAEKIRNHKEWAHIKKVKIEAEQAKRLALKYKRSFGRDERMERKMLFKESRALYDWAKDLERTLVDNIMEKTKVVASTLVGAAHYSLNDYIFDVVIIDEASQALEPECWIAFLKAKKIILAGDHKQLPPTVKSKKAIELGFTNTILDQLSPVKEINHLLDTQYRMHPNILSFSNKRFYQNKLKSDATLVTRQVSSHLYPIVWVDTAGCGFEEAFNDEHKSYSNEGEYFILREYILQIKDHLEGLEIGVIAPYSGQVKYIRDQAHQEELFKGLDIEIDSIDGFQGQEKDVIFLLFTRSNANGIIGFTADERRLNVALTRAKHSIVTIGDSATMCQTKLYDDLYSHIENTGIIQSAWEYMKY